MSEKFKLVMNPRKHTNQVSLDAFSKKNAQKARKFHKSFDRYQTTPLVVLDNLAKEIGVKKIFVKDESYRFGLNAFKVLGGSYAIGSYLAKRLGVDIDDLPYPKMISDEVRKELGEITFITATDGNHGRGIAWTAKQLQQKAVVYMPKGSVQRRLNNITAEGADAKITSVNFDDTVRLAFKDAQKNNWVMTQDTTFENYYEFPQWCMQGYTTIAYETYEQLNEINEKPTHIFIQAGAGSFSGALEGFFASEYGKERPVTLIIESDKADCILRTAKADDGKLHFVTDDMSTIMAGLACGEPCSIGWEVLRDYADAFVSCEDCVSAKGVRVLANPLGNDSKVVSGESGSVGIGLLAEIMTNVDYHSIKEKLQIDSNSKILCFSTEGDTDPDNYKDIVWKGRYPNV
jgi:diaminopropionate ammonia-lyase